MQTILVNSLAIDHKSSIAAYRICYKNQSIYSNDNSNTIYLDIGADNLIMS